jgi:integrase
MPTSRLTDAKVRGAKPRSKPYKLADGGALHLLVAPSGARLWRYRFRLAGKEGTFAVGSFPEMGLADARKARDEARALVDRGINPADARNAERAANLAAAEARRREDEGAFAKVVAAWLEDGKKTWSAGTHRQKRSRVERFLLPKLGALPIAKITPTDLRPVLEACQKAGAWAGVHAKVDLNGIFDFAIRAGLGDGNPIPGLRALVTVPKSESKAALTLAQIRTFFAKLAGYRGYPESVFAIKLIALTACRPGEAANAEWSEFDLEANLWRRPASKMKARREHVSPLSSQALELLTDLKVISGTHRYLFPHRIQPDQHATPERLNWLMKDMALGRGATPHCWRASFSTWANEAGHAPDAIERQLAHVEASKVRASYNKALLVDERRKIMQAWGDYLEAASHDNVVPLRGRVA